jgi:hypothetical protein
MENITIIEELDEVVLAKEDEEEEEDDFEGMLCGIDGYQCFMGFAHIPIPVKYSIDEEEDENHGWLLKAMIDHRGYFHFEIQLKINVVMKGLIIQLFYNDFFEPDEEWDKHNEETQYPAFCRAFQDVQKKIRERHARRYNAVYAPASSESG